MSRKVIKLSEGQLRDIIKRIISEQTAPVKKTVAPVKKAVSNDPYTKLVGQILNHEVKGKNIGFISDLFPGKIIGEISVNPQGDMYKSINFSIVSADGTLIQKDIFYIWIEYVEAMPTNQLFSKLDTQTVLSLWNSGKAKIALGTDGKPIIKRTSLSGPYQMVAAYVAAKGDDGTPQEALNLLKQANPNSINFLRSDLNSSQNYDDSLKKEVLPLLNQQSK